MSNAITGEDWLTGRKLSTTEQVVEGIFGTIGAVPGLGSIAKQAVTTGLADDVVRLVTSSASVADDAVKAAVDSGKTATGTKPPLKMNLQFFADKGDDAAVGAKNASGAVDDVIDDALPGRNGALNQAKKDANIPKSQQPDSVTNTPMRQAEYEGGHVIKDVDGNIINTREYNYTNSEGKKITIQDHGAGHEKGGQGPYFNVRPSENTRTGKVEGTLEHYPFNK